VEAIGIDRLRRARSLAARPNRMSAGHEPRAYTGTPSGVAQAAGDREMTRFGYVIATYLAVMGTTSRRSFRFRSA
jgi:hypothetical protein